MTATGRPRRGRLLAVALAVAALVSGCGLPEDDHARPIDSIPAELLATPTSDGASTASGDESLVLYFYNDTTVQLARLERPTATAPTVQQALDALAVPPNQEEISAAGVALSTKLPANLFPTAGEIGQDGSLQVSVSVEASPALRALQQEGADRLQRVYAQVVCTLVEVDDQVKSVQIIDPEGMVPVEGQDGALIDNRGVTPADLNDCKTGEQLVAEELENSSTTTTR